MNVLVTSSRMPFALDEIRKLARRGHRVIAADTIRSAPGGHSRYAAARVHVAPPAFLPERFISDVKQIVLTRKIDLVVPCFEEVFYLARHLPELSELAQVFASGFDPLARLHNKATFNALARELRVLAPDTTVVTNRGDLSAAVRTYRRYFARPAWSRGGLDLFTNAGPLAGAVDVTACAPTDAQPWIVQEYVDGFDLCSFSIAQHGRLVAHCSYVHPKQIEHAGGIVFQSVVDGDTLAIAQRIVEATGYHGQISMDFRRNGHGLFVIECNPRPTAGAHLMPDDMLVDAIMLPPSGAARIAPAGVRRKYAAALVRDIVLHRDQLKDDLAHLFSDAGDVYGEKGDLLPALFQLLSYARGVLPVRGLSRGRSRPGTSLMAAYFDGITWNGDAIP